MINGVRAPFFVSKNRQEVNSTWYPKIEKPIKSCKKHYSLVLYILTINITRIVTICWLQSCIIKIYQFCANPWITLSHWAANPAFLVHLIIKCDKVVWCANQSTARLRTDAKCCAMSSNETDSPATFTLANFKAGSFQRWTVNLFHFLKVNSPWGRSTLVNSVDSLRSWQFDRAAPTRSVQERLRADILPVQS